MNKIKTYLAIAALLIIAIGATYFITKWRAEDRIQYLEQGYQIQLDSLTVMARAARATAAGIQDSLEAVDSAFARYVRQTEGQINSYTRIIGRLRVEKDSLANENRLLAGRISVGELMNTDSSVTNTFKDTLISRTETWSDSLFATTAIAQFQDDSLSLRSRLEQLRDIRLDIVGKQSDDRERVNIFVRSPDFDSLEVRSFTEIAPKKRKPWGWAVAALLLIREGLSIFNVFK